jgi:site-specific DNA recombinase
MAIGLPQAPPGTSAAHGVRATGRRRAMGRLVDPRRQFSNSSPAAKSLVKRVGKTDEVRTDPRFEDARGPNVRELRCVQRRLSTVEIEALIADYEAGGRVSELAQVYGIHRTTVSAHVARAGKTRRQLTEAQIEEAVRLYEEGWSLRAVGQRLDVSDKAIRRLLDERTVAIRPRGRVAAGALAS